MKILFKVLGDSVGFMHVILNTYLSLIFISDGLINAWIIVRVWGVLCVLLVISVAWS